MKRVVLIFLFFIALFGVYSYASDFSYELDANQNASITAYHGSSTDITIPSTIDGHPVKSIAMHAFNENRNTTNGHILTSVIISKGITTVGDFAFIDCSNLQSVSLPESLTSLGQSTFLHCSKLNKINIPSHLKRLEEFVFQETGFTEFIIPESLEYIGYSAFRSCNSLTAFYVHSKNVTFDDNIFEYSPNVTIYGHEGSTSQNYASKNNLKFKLLSDSNTPNPDKEPDKEPDKKPDEEPSEEPNKQPTKDSTLNTNTFSNQSSNVSSISDNTIANRILPNTGSKCFLLLLCIVSILAFLFYRKHRNFNDF